MRLILFLLILSQACTSGHCCGAAASAFSYLRKGAAAFYGFFPDQIRDELMELIKSFPSWIWHGLRRLKLLYERMTGGSEEIQPVLLVRELPEQSPKCIINRSQELTELKELFDSFSTSTDDKIVNAVHLMGLPGSGKSELARQYGTFVFKQHGVSTVITLNTESKEQFRGDLVEAILELTGAQGKDKVDPEELKGNEMSSLMYKLKMLLRGRPGWLLIVDNIRDKNTIKQNFYQDLPKPGTETWGNGQMLFTTQVLLEKESQHVRINKTNKGMTPNDAKKLLCELVRRAEGDCPDKEAEVIVRKLEYFPLSIFAAGTYIELMMRAGEPYSLAEYLNKIGERIRKALANSVDAKTGYPHSMLTAVLLAVQKSMEGESDDTVKDFCAFLGFIGLQEISFSLVDRYLRYRGHNTETILRLIDFHLVDYVEKENLFRVHQVTRYAFLEELTKRSTGDPELLVGNIRKMLNFSPDAFSFEERRSFLRNVFIRHKYSFNDIFTPEFISDFSIFHVYDLHISGFVNCSELARFVTRLPSAKVSVKIIGCMISRSCHHQITEYVFDEYADKCIEVLKASAVPKGLARDLISLDFELWSMFRHKPDNVSDGRRIWWQSKTEVGSLIIYGRSISYTKRHALLWPELFQLCHGKPYLTKILLIRPKMCFEQIRLTDQSEVHSHSILTFQVIVI